MRMGRIMRKTDRSAVTEIAEQLCGGQTMVGRLRRVLVRSPEARSLEHWREFGWREAPDTQRLLAEHERFCQRLADSGADVVYGRSSVEADPDAIYAHDVSLISDEGAIVLRPGKELRRVEMAAATVDLEAAGVPVVASLDAPACAEAGRGVWLAQQTLLVGRTAPANRPGTGGLLGNLAG